MKTRNVSLSVKLYSQTNSISIHKQNIYSALFLRKCFNWAFKRYENNWKATIQKMSSKLCLILGYKTKNDSLNHKYFQMKIIELVVTYTTNQMIHTTYHEFIPFEFSFQIDAMNASIYTKKCFIQKETHKPRWECDKKMYEQIGRFAAVSWKWMEKDLNKRESTAKHSLFYFIHWLVSREFEV